MQAGWIAKCLPPPLPPPPFPVHHPRAPGHCDALHHFLHLHLDLAACESGPVSLPSCGTPGTGFCSTSRTASEIEK